MASVEEIKRNSRNLQGTLRETLNSDASHFQDADKQLLKFHGIYQEVNRDLRGDEQARYIFMVRCRLPGGNLTPQQYLALDDLAGACGNGTLRITSRQDLQLHGVRKAKLAEVITRIHRAGLTTWGGCGDVTRNIMAAAAPLKTSVHTAVQELAAALARELLPRTTPYAKLWQIAGQPQADESPDPLYSAAYLPRKFKIGIAVPPVNDVDIYTQDLGVVPHFPRGEIEGYTLLAGGGLGMDHGRVQTFPALARPFLYVPANQVVNAARAILTVFRDHGNREDRKQARLKYLIARKGWEWFRQEVEKNLGQAGEEPKTFAFTTVADLLGWRAQYDGRFFYTLRVETGRIQDGESGSFRGGIRALAQTFQCPIRLTPNHNIVFYDLPPQDRQRFNRILDEHHLRDAETPTTARQSSLACVGLPTCNLALTESERVYPKVMAQVDELLRELQLDKEPLLVRMTGCANGCARPYVADIAFVGRGPGKYALYIGGSHSGDRLARLAAPEVPLEQAAAALRPYLQAFAAQRQPNETFSGWWGRAHPELVHAKPEQFHTPCEQPVRASVAG